MHCRSSSPAPIRMPGATAYTAMWQHHDWHELRGVAGAKPSRGAQVGAAGHERGARPLRDRGALRARPALTSLSGEDGRCLCTGQPQPGALLPSCRPPPLPPLVTPVLTPSPPIRPRGPSGTRPNNSKRRHPPSTSPIHTPVECLHPLLSCVLLPLPLRPAATAVSTCRLPPACGRTPLTPWTHS